MVYKRRKLLPTGRKNWKRVIGKIQKISRALKAIQPETKWAEYQDAAAVANYSGTIVSFNVGLTQGTGDYGNRVGDTLTMKGLRLRLQPNTIAFNNSVIYRIIVFQYLNDPDGATSTASLTNLLMHSAQIGMSLAPSAPYDHDNRSSFKIHYDKTFTFNVGALTTANVNPGSSRHHIINIPFKQGSKYAKVQYYSAGTTTTKNELFMLVLTDSATNMAIPYVGHLYYTDS